jgi:beta-galactosidase
MHGTLAASDNGSITDHTAFTSPTRAATAGRALAMVRADAGKAPVTIRVSAPGLAPGSVTLKVTP